MHRREPNDRQRRADKTRPPTHAPRRFRTQAFVHLLLREALLGEPRREPLLRGEARQIPGAVDWLCNRREMKWLHRLLCAGVRELHTDEPLTPPLLLLGRAEPPLCAVFADESDSACARPVNPAQLVAAGLSLAAGRVRGGRMGRQQDRPCGAARRWEGRRMEGDQ